MICTVPVHRFSLARTQGNWMNLTRGTDILIKKYKIYSFRNTVC